MKDTRELLGLLTVKVQRFSVAPSGIPKLTPQDIAHALALVKSPPARLYGRVKYADQTEFAPELSTELLYACSTIDGFGKWRVNRPGLLQDLCAMALFESIHPHVCPWCHGRGEASIESRIVSCDACAGAGRRHMSDTDRIRLIKISKSAWYENWPNRYKSIQSIVDRWDEICYSAIRKRLTEPTPA